MTILCIYSFEKWRGVSRLYIRVRFPTLVRRVWLVKRDHPPMSSDSSLGSPSYMEKEAIGSVNMDVVTCVGILNV